MIPPRGPRRLERTDAAIAAALAVGYVALLLATVKDLGYARDEGFYFHAAGSYARWFELLARSPGEAVTARAVDAAWGVNHEHPALVKSLFAVSSLVQQRYHPFEMDGTAYRFPAMALAGLLLGLVYVWGAEVRGRAAGLGAALLLGMMPRFFYQSHLACFDIPIVAMWTASAYAWWKSQTRGGRCWPVITGIAFGLALQTKHNSWFLPFACVAHAAAVQAWARFVSPERRFDREALRRQLAALACMAVLGPLILWATWPWLWRSPVARFAEYARFHLGHEYYNMEFFGETYWRPPMPRAYAPIMTIATVPTITLVLVAIGLWIRVRAMTRRYAGRAGDALATVDVLWLLGIFASYAAWLRASTPIFGGTKHWMTAYPLMCLFAGVALADALRAARARLARARLARRNAMWPELAVLAAVAAAPITETVRSHPWGLSSYVPLVGGAAGGATLGLNRSFWGYTTGAIADYLNESVPPKGRVYIHDTAGPSWDMLQRDGRLRRDIHGVWSAAEADFVLYHHEMHMQAQEYQAWVLFGTVRPDHVAGLDGVPVIWVYRRRP